jgi:hypothetical protein
MTYEETIEVRRLLEDAVRAVSAANESASCQAQIAELEDSIRRLEMSGEGHHGWVAGGGETPQPFDPNFEADDETGEIHLGAIGPGYAPWGRKLIDVAQPGSDSDVMSATSGRLGLKITHPESASSLPTAEIIVASGRNTFPQSTDEITYLPLYDFDNGRITLDLRCYLALGVYE